MYNVDEYINSVVFKEFKLNTLFILADVYSSKIQYVYQNPIEIVRTFWQQHSVYFSYDESYYDTLDYLVEKSKELQYHVPSIYIDGLLKEPTKVSSTKINNAALLFLVQHSALSPGLLFGYAEMPEQMRLMRDALYSIGCLNISTTIQSMLFNATDEKCRTISVVMQK